MKFIYIPKKQLFKFSLLICIIILISILLIPSYNPNTSDSINVFKPISESYSYDFTGNGKKDTLSITTNSKGKDVKISTNNNNYSLASLCDDNYLCDDIKYWPMDVYVKNLSRKTTPEIIVTGTKNRKAITYIFRWCNNKFINIFTDEKNIFGVLDSKGNSTPQCYSINSSSLSNINAFMIIDNDLLNISSFKQVPDIDKVQKFIDLIQTNYELDEIPDIFTDDIAENELGILWNLDKDHNVYSFQSGFFYDENINEKGIITSTKWRLNFERYVKEKDDSYKAQISICLTSTLMPDNSYKISSFYKNQKAA
ncbi:MAG: hypothetical protein PUE01_09030 [Clostridiaceae bacterium]|nr:hypothetical protein [Clostridiaceae bacterium]